VKSSVAVWASADVVTLVEELVKGTACDVVAVDSMDGVLALRELAAAVIGEHVDDRTLQLLARRVPDEERHRILVITPHTWDVQTDVAWTVLRKSELTYTLPRLVEDAEAVAVDLLAGVKGGQDTVSRYGCVASIASTFLLVAVDDPPGDVAVVSFVLPGHGRLEVRGALTPAFGRSGLWRLTPESETVRAALRAFTLGRVKEDEQ